MAVAAMGFVLNPDLDAGALAAKFARDGRVQVKDFLARESAEALHLLLRERSDWVQVLNVADKVYELSRETRAQMSEAARADLDNAIYAQARQGFQYRYESIRVPDAAAARAVSSDSLAAFAEWMSGGEARDLLRKVVGAADIAFADAQGTAYSPGDFLTGHDDAVAGKNRHAAYVFGLTPVWRTEWGGLLLIHEPELGGFVPAFNTLNLFRVPQMHSVSEVTRAAAFRRYSITGWLRSGER
ncbi:MAG: proline hydroxylase [Novosphingobium sp. 16-62-11]|uniref:2OG-Fe(II) oxygenase n=1 Tax=Novosphingobium sp. 17-62-19 TaxID=1970406 RepID=UPI000BD467D0|nr:2OG-Fe(II) oxygenase family protein [Novosphingobium sp. 17-62-19]OYX94081.1 MAG: proline hydroxylase [Novosphingobium sp. 35-62-5]OYZ43411.1 MAG: proline hydroxylase [Novosphingobium sp. 16-62-11]OZA21169.1 MAG: proline hydroxylase [Novosphingobium sp. 17-62-19]